MKNFSRIAILTITMVIAICFASCKNEPDVEGPTYFTVTFETNGGTAVEVQKIESGKTVTKPDDPTKSATDTKTFVFAGWYSDSKLTEEFDFTTKITKDIKLYAKWTENVITHIVTFNTRGGSVITSQTVIHGSKALKPDDPIKNGTYTTSYTFENWYTSTNGGITLSDTAFDFDTEITGNITLYAKWTEVVRTYTVSFVTNGGTDVEKQTVTFCSNATKPSDPTKEDSETVWYTFENWYTSIDDGTTLSNTAFNFNTMITHDITLYAKWTETPHNIIYLNVPHSFFKSIFDQMFADKPYKNSFKNATKFAKSTEKPDSNLDYVDKSDGHTNLYFWYDETTTTIFYYLDAGKKIQIIDAQWMFFKLNRIKSIETSDFDTSKVTNMSEMFAACSELPSIDVSNFDTSNVTSMTGMFTGCNTLNSLDLTNFDTSNVTSMNDMFTACATLNSLDLTNFDTSNVTNMNSMFSYCDALTDLDLSKFSTSKVTSMAGMFECCYALKSLDLTNFDTSNVTNMSNMFRLCYTMKSLDLSNFNTSNVTDMTDMFYCCDAMKHLDLSNFDTSNVTNMRGMFHHCKDLTSLDITNFDTSNVTDMSNMFYECYAMTSLNLSNFDTSNVTSMASMFDFCKDLTSLDISNFDTNNVTDMSRMFYCCTALTSLDITSFNTSKVTDMYDMFHACLVLTTIYASNTFVTTNLQNSEPMPMFLECKKLKGGNGTEYDNNKFTSEYARIDGGTETPGYFTTKANQ